MSQSLTLGKSQELFAECFAKLTLWLISKGYQVRYNDVCPEGYREGYQIAKNSKGQLERTGSKMLFEDAVHMLPGCHYFKLAGDINLFKYGVWLKEGNETIWKDAGDYWKSLNPLCTWGGDFGDANHFSVTFNGKR